MEANTHHHSIPTLNTLGQMELRSIDSCAKLTLLHPLPPHYQQFQGEARRVELEGGITKKTDRIKK